MLIVVANMAVRPSSLARVRRIIDKIARVRYNMCNIMMEVFQYGFDTPLERDNGNRVQK